MTLLLLYMIRISSSSSSMMMTLIMLTTALLTTVHVVSVVAAQPTSSGVATTTRYWDCSGGACGCAYLPSHLDHTTSSQGGGPKPSHCYSNGLFVAPTNNPYNAKYYGTAAISEALGGGYWLAQGCGKCWKVTGTSNIIGYDTTTTTTIVLKGANFCPPSNAACSTGKPHFDIAAPGFDYMGSSLSNTCAQVEPNELSGLTSCNNWMISSGTDPNDSSTCDCTKFTNPTLRAGCHNFQSLYWNNPTVSYEELTDCPMELATLPCWEENNENYPSVGSPPPELCLNHPVDSNIEFNQNNPNNDDGDGDSGGGGTGSGGNEEVDSNISDGPADGNSNGGGGGSDSGGGGGADWQNGGSNTGGGSNSGGDSGNNSNFETPPSDSSFTTPTTTIGGGLIVTAKLHDGMNEGLYNSCGLSVNNDVVDLGDVFPYGMAAAIGDDKYSDDDPGSLLDFERGYGCGSCYEVTCVGVGGAGSNTDDDGCTCSTTTPSVVVQVIEQCWECDSSSATSARSGNSNAAAIALNKNAMSQITESGRSSSSSSATCAALETSIRRVNCDYSSPSESQNIILRSKEGVSEYWYGLYIFNVAGYGSVRSIELRSSSGGGNGGDGEFDVPCEKTDGPSYFRCQIPDPTSFIPPLDVRVTDTYGRSLLGLNVITDITQNTNYDFGTNFEPFHLEEEDTAGEAGTRPIQSTSTSLSKQQQQKQNSSSSPSAMAHSLLWLAVLQSCAVAIAVTFSS